MTSKDDTRYAYSRLSAAAAEDDDPEASAADSGSGSGSKPSFSAFPNRGTAAGFLTRRRTTLLALSLLGTMLLLASFAHPALRSNVWRASRTYLSAAAQKARDEQPYYTLPSGDRIPAVALGTWKATPGEVGAAVSAALKEGYVHIDGAWIYGNEAEVGEAIAKSDVPREDIWLTSKLWNDFHNPEDIEGVVDESLKRLQTSYLDLYLIHWPVAFKKNGENNAVDFDLTENPYPTWKKLEELVDKGKIKNIGVSNFNVRRLTNLTANKLKYRPAVNQVELNWFNPQPELVSWSKANGVLLEAYSPLGSNNQVKQVLNQPVIKAVSAETGLTPAQVVLSWLWQRGAVVLPKSVHAERIRENFKVQKLSQEAFDKVEKDATSHPPKRTLDPGPSWGIDIFEDDK